MLEAKRFLKLRLLTAMQKCFSGVFQLLDFCLLAIGQFHISCIVVYSALVGNSHFLFVN